MRPQEMLAEDLRRLGLLLLVAMLGLWAFSPSHVNWSELAASPRAGPVCRLWVGGLPIRELVDRDLFCRVVWNRGGGCFAASE